jgi:hypothetical protein
VTDSIRRDNNIFTYPSDYLPVSAPSRFTYISHLHTTQKFLTVIKDCSIWIQIILRWLYKTCFQKHDFYKNNLCEEEPFLDLKCKFGNSAVYFKKLPKI